MRAPIGQSMVGESYAMEAAGIVRSCVHCGFCNATCPTYQLTGDELEGPRGRIYLIKGLLEQGQFGEQTRRHLDQCLLCRNCETTCPSGVQYGRLIELVRPPVYRVSGAPWSERSLRWLLVRVLPYRRRFAAVVASGRLLRHCLPRRLAALVPVRRVVAAAKPIPRAEPSRRVLILEGCVQPVLNPAIDAAAVQVLGHLGFEVLSARGGACCGALAHHLGYDEDARRQARRNIDAWWSYVETGVTAIMATSSGCGVHLKDYARLLADDPVYAERARAIESLVRDPVELVDAKVLRGRFDTATVGPVAVQTPCTLQHGQRQSGRIEEILDSAGFNLVAAAEPHLCCGSAGTYSLLHGAAAAALRERKLGNLLQARPAVIATANIGCQMHLQPASPVPVRHWLELLADCLPG